ncbi:MAG: signal peptide peptidase SppA, partial [Bacteroidetes bacterium]
ENRAQTEAYLGDLWDAFADQVAISRNHPRADLDQIAAETMILRGHEAAAAGLIDASSTESEMLARLSLATGREALATPRLLSLRQYGQTRPAGTHTRDRIAVIVAEGVMQGGESHLDVAGAETLVSELRRARTNDRIKAVVLRINSPGGDALAAELIAEEILATQAVKPVVASMGDYAASGGYYIAAPCQEIFANPSTLTGSIGVFGVLWDAEQALDEQLGLGYDRVETHPHATIGNPGFSMRPAEEAFFQQNVAHTYGLFLRRVQEGRGMADSIAVDSLAQGRVWSGRAANTIGLVDTFGGLQDAIDRAAELAGLGESIRIELRPQLKTPLVEMLEEMTGARSLSPALAGAVERVEELRRFVPGSGVYALDLSALGEIE